MHCRSNCQAMLFYAYCAIISQLYVILCLLSYGAHFGLLCLLCHNKPTVCHTMPTRVPCYAYNVILKLQHLLWHTMLTNTMPIFHNKPPVCQNLPTKVQCYPYYNILRCSAYCGILCNNKPTMPIDRQPRRFIYPKDGGRFDAPKMHVFTHLLRKCFTGKSKVRLRPPKSTIYGGSKWPLFTPKTAWIKIA